MNDSRFSEPTPPRGVRIRAEDPRDRATIGDVHRAAFGGDAEARLVDRLRDCGHIQLSLVAESAGHVIGHVLFSRMWIDVVRPGGSNRPPGTATSSESPTRSAGQDSWTTNDGTLDALALAPLSVLPVFQRRGVGSALVTQGLELCAAAGHRIVLVVGPPEYYRRFGFSHELARALRSPYQGDAFLARELVAGALAQVCGAVRYAPPFGDLEAGH